MKRMTAFVLAIVMTALLLTACGNTENAETEEAAAIEPVTALPKPDMTKWSYMEEQDIYYQIGIGYCETPADEKYEKLAVFVPGAYMDATDNGDDTYACELNESAALNGYTASTAPIVMPIITPGYLGCEAMTAEYLNRYSELISLYTSQGFVFAFAGCRGVYEGAPAGVTDLKAAIRFLRYADDVYAGDAESVFVYGMSGGGAQAAILGASGDSKLYDPYLEAVGAVQGVSDAVKGSMDWCPIIDFDTADAGYEWMLGCTRQGRTEEQQQISDRLAQAYAAYVNDAGFTDENGKKLTLRESEDGIYQAGTYYEYLKSVIEESLDHYLSDSGLSGDTAQTYIDSLNDDHKWIDYDRSSNTVEITSVADFCKACKHATDLPFGFDQPAGSSLLFGNGQGEGSHFCRILTDVLTELNVEYASDYADDLAKTDAFGNTVERRVEMYSPLFYLTEGREGFGASKAAAYWRIRSGIKQPTTSLTTEVNLALALNHCDGVKSVDFETVWEKSHEEAERTGDSVTNFIAWVNDCMKNS